MENLSLHVLDIAENSIRAGARCIRISLVKEDASLILCIEDDGRGMDAQQQQQALDPFFTTKAGKRFGLGLALLFQASRATGGRMTIDSAPGEGTCVRAVFEAAHPDMKPLGDMLATLAVLIAGHPEIRFVYDHDGEGTRTHFDSAASQTAAEQDN